MRTVNIYKKVSGSLVGVALGCIQTGDADLDVTQSGKFYEMSDGTVQFYPVPTAKTGMTLTLETTKQSAESIRKAAHFGELYFEGIRIGDLEGTSGTAYRAYISGTVKIGAKYANCNIYSVVIPLRFDASEEVLRSEVVT